MAERLLKRITHEQLKAGYRVYRPDQLMAITAHPWKVVRDRGDGTYDVEVPPVARDPRGDAPQCVRLAWQ